MPAGHAVADEPSGSDPGLPGPGASRQKGPTSSVDVSESCCARFEPVTDAPADSAGLWQRAGSTVVDVGGTTVVDISGWIVRCRPPLGVDREHQRSRRSQPGPRLGRRRDQGRLGLVCVTENGSCGPAMSACSMPGSWAGPACTVHVRSPMPTCSPWQRGRAPLGRGGPRPGRLDRLSVRALPSGRLDPSRGAKVLTVDSSTEVVFRCGTRLSHHRARTACRSGRGHRCSRPPSRADWSAAD